MTLRLKNIGKISRILTDREGRFFAKDYESAARYPT